MPTPFLDTFQEVGGIPTTLVGSTPDVGTGWATPFGSSVYVIAPNGEVCMTVTDVGSQNDVVAQVTGGYGTADYTATAIYKNLTLPNQSYTLFVRGTGSRLTGYRLTTFPGTGPEIDFYVGNTFIATVSSSFGGSVGPLYTMSLNVTGNVIKVYLNGVLSYTYTDASNLYPSQGFAGLGAGATAVTSVTGSHWTHFQIDTLASGNPALLESQNLLGNLLEMSGGIRG